MDMIRNRLIPVLGAGALVAVVAIAMADGDDDKKPKDKPDKAADSAGKDGESDAAADADAPQRKYRAKTKLCRRLACDEALDKQVTDILETFKDVKRDADIGIRNARKEMAAGYRNDEIDAAGMETALGSIREQEKVTYDAANKALVEMHALMSPEQRAQITDMVEKRGPLYPFSERTEGGDEEEAERRPKKGTRPSRADSRRGDARRARGEVDPRRREFARERGDKAAAGG